MRIRVGSGGTLTRVVITLGLIVFLVTSCTQDQPPGPAGSNDEPLQITRNFTTTESDSGVVRYVVRARIARMYADDVTRAEDVEVDFYDEGRKVSVLHSREGFLDADGRLRARGDVVVTAVEGGVLETQELYWDRQAGKIRTDDAFKITEKGDVLTGVGLTSTPNLDLIEIDREVIGSLHEKPQTENR
jgi:lipopolysaccharide export system protein LptC